MPFLLNLGNMVVKLRADAANFDKVILKAQERIQSASASLASAGSKLSIAVTAPLTLFAAKAVNSFGAFNQAMVESTSIMGDVSDEMQGQMADLAREMATRSTTSATELAKSYFFLASAGLDAAQSMKVLETVDRFAIAGAFDMATATDLLTDSQMALGLAMKDPIKNMEQMKRVSDAIVLANTQSNASVEQFARALGADAAVASRQLGMELSTLLAVLDAYAGQSIKAEHAGNLAGRAFRLLTKASRENGAVFQKMGIRVVDEATGKYRNFIDIIADMENAFKGMTKPAKAAALEQLGFAALAQKSILPLIGLSDKMKEWESAQKNAAGTTEKVAAKQLRAFNNQMTMFWNTIDVTVASIGERLIPYLKALIGVVQAVVSWWKGLNDSTKNVIVGFGVAAASLGPLLLGMAGLVSVGGWIATAFSSVIGVGSSIIGIFTGMAGAIAGLSAPIVIAIAAVVGFFVLFFSYTETGQQLLDDFGESLSWWGGALGEFFERVKTTLKGVGDALAAGDILLAVKILWAQIKLEWAKGIETIAFAFGGLLNPVIDTFQNIATFAVGVAWMIANTFRERFQAIVKAAAWVAEKSLEAAYAAGAITVDTFVKKWAQVQNVKKGLTEAVAKPSETLGNWFDKMVAAAPSDITRSASADVVAASREYANLLSEAGKKHTKVVEERQKQEQAAANTTRAQTAQMTGAGKPAGGFGAAGGGATTTGTFQQVLLSRFSLESVGASAPGGQQEVRAKGVENRLDALIDVVKGGVEVARVG